MSTAKDLQINYQTDTQKEHTAAWRLWQKEKSVQPLWLNLWKREKLW